MKSVSEAFKVAMKKAQRVEHIKGTIGSFAFGDSNILALSYSNQCSENKDVKFGSVRIGQLDVHFRGLNIPRGSWRSLKITLEYGLTLADESIEWVKCGVFTVAKAEWTDTGIKVTAYDCLAGLDVAFPFSTTSGVLYDFLELTERITGVENGLSRAECNALPNGNELLGLYPQNDISTVRDFLSCVASTTGGFVTASDEGKILIKSFADSSVVDTFQSRDRIVGSVFSDYVTSYDGISISDIDGGVQYYYAAGSVGGVTISLGSNPLLQYGVDEAKIRQRQAVAEVAGSIAYTPFNIAILNCPVYDLGDLVVCEGGVAGDTLTCCVMAIEWTFKNTTTLKGFGSDPNLMNGKSSTDRALQGALNKTKENELVIHTYINASEYTLADNTPETVIDIDFTTVKHTIVTMLHEINIDLDVTGSTATVTAYYYLNDVLEAYQPVGTFSEDGKHILTLMYFVDTLLDGNSYEWKVKLEVDGGTATIDRGDIHAWLQGQGLLAIDDFDGHIEVQDTFTPVTGGQMIVALAESLTLDVQTPFDLVGSDTLSSVYAGQNIASLSDNMALTREKEHYFIITEDEDNLATEDDDIFIS